MAWPLIFHICLSYLKTFHRIFWRFWCMSKTHCDSCVYPWTCQKNPVLFQKQIRYCLLSSHFSGGQETFRQIPHIKIKTSIWGLKYHETYKNMTFIVCSHLQRKAVWLCRFLIHTICLRNMEPVLWCLCGKDAAEPERCWVLSYIFIISCIWSHGFPSSGTPFNTVISHLFF